jgi:7-carboxy-7-deazaguanine synthase
VYCDTAYAFSGGDVIGVDEILYQVEGFGARYVTVTGGEPLAQEACFGLLEKLCDRDLNVSLETSGALDISKVDPRVCRVMDIKTPASGEVHRNLYTNVDYLGRGDEVKFVICSREDYEWSRFKIDEYQLTEKVSNVLMSASHGVLDPADLAEWILHDKLNVRLQLQLHKYLWGDKRGV